MNTLKRMMVALLSLLALAAGTAFADTEHGYSRIFIFGASFVDSGYADLLDIMAAPDQAAVMAIMGGMATSIADNIDILYDCGARNLLFAYLLPSEYSPIANGGLPPDQVPTGLSKAYNDMYLLPIVVAPNSERMNVWPVDFHSFVEETVMVMPEFFGFTNVTDSCVTPGVTQEAVCKDRDGHFWWDQLHPTKTAHALFAEFALGELSLAPN